MSRLKIGVVVGSIRDTRFADKPAQYILQKANERPEIDAEILDVRDFDLPLFNEAASNLWVPSQDERAVAWQNKVSEFDGYIFVVAEYNRSIPGSLKNALDQAYVNWNKKPFTAIAYGSVGGTRAMEHLRTIGVELQMVSTRSAVHIGGSDFFTVWGGGGNQPMDSIEKSIAGSVKDSLDQLIWWGNATRAARNDDAAQAQAAE